MIIFLEVANITCVFSSNKVLRCSCCKCGNKFREQGGGIQGWERCGKLLIENRICEIQLSRLTSFEYVVQFTQI